MRDHGALTVLLGQLLSPSLTVVSNACGTLWNLSARCPEDQLTLWKEGAVPMLRSLINSKHKMISMGSSAALKNLLQARPEGMSIVDSKHGLGLPTLQARKQKALEQELDQNLAETCDNIEDSPRSSPTEMLHSLGPNLETMRLSSAEMPQGDVTMSANREKMQNLLTLKHQPQAADMKVQNLGNKYCNGAKPVAQINNYVDSSTREFEDERPTDFSLK